MSLIVTVNLPLHVVFESVANGKVPGLVLHEDSWLVETEDARTGGFLEKGPSWKVQASISFYGKGMQGVSEIMGLLKAGLPSLEWEVE